MRRTIPIPGTNRTLGGEDVFIVAEIGKNFIETPEDRPIDEYLENAKRLVALAHEAGADAVKFQTHEVEDEQLPVTFESPHFSGADRHRWITRNTEATPVDAFWRPLKDFCDELGILFFSTPMSRKAAEKLETIGVPFWKIGSGDVEDHALLDFVAASRKPVVISSGMVSLKELDETAAYLSERGVPTSILYCVSKYPAPKEYFNLASIEHFLKRYPDAVIGFSDHSIGTEVALAAVKVGARIVEKHFSLSRDLWGADHKVSMTPEELKELVRSIRSGAWREVDPSPYYGDPGRELEGSVNEFRPYFNKTLVAGADIAPGGIFSQETIYAMRPRKLLKGLPAHRFHDVIGRRAKRPFKKYEPLEERDIL